MGGQGSGVPNARERIFRVNELWQMIIDNNGELKNKILAMFSYKFGTQRRTMNDYLKVLIYNNKIKEKDGRLWK